MTTQRWRRMPRGLAAVAAVATVLFAVPIVGLVIQTPWNGLWAILTSSVVVDALRISLIASVLATAASIILGFPVAYVLARGDFYGKALVRGLVLLPLVLPPVVGGAALLFSLGRRGVVGEVLYDATGLVLPFSIWGVVIAATFVSMPFLILTVEGGLRNADRGLEDAASSLGAGPWTVFRRVTIPLIGPSVAAGTVLTWARAFGEFGATVTFAGNLGGRTQTMPLAVFVALDSNRPTAIALSLVMMVISLVVLVALRDRWWRAP